MAKKLLLTLRQGKKRSSTNPKSALVAYWGKNQQGEEVAGGRLGIGSADERGARDLRRGGRKS